MYQWKIAGDFLEKGNCRALLRKMTYKDTTSTWIMYQWKIACVFPQKRNCRALLRKMTYKDTASTAYTVYIYVYTCIREIQGVLQCVVAACCCSVLLQCAAVLLQYVAVWCSGDTGWRRPMGCLKLQVIFCKRATNYRALLQKKWPMKIRHPLTLRHLVSLL